MHDKEDAPPDDIEDLEKYLPAPTQYWLDIGSGLVFDFVAQNLPEQSDQLRGIFRRKGGYGEFKELLARWDLLESWYA